MGQSYFQGVQAKLIFLHEEDKRAVLDLMRRFSSAHRFAYNRLLEGWSRKELKKQDGPLCALFDLNTRYAGDAILKAEMVLSSARERGENPRKVIFGGRKLFLDLQKKHNPKLLKKRKQEWKEKRQGLLYSRGDKAKGGNLNLRLEVEKGALWLRVNLGNGTYAYALVQTSHPNLGQLLQRVYAKEPYNVELNLRNGQVYASFTWEEKAPPLVHTKDKGVLALDVNADPYHLALALVGPDGNLLRYSTLSLEEVDQAQSRGAKETLLWTMAHKVVDFALASGVAIATERLKYLRKSRRGDGSGRAFRRWQHRFAYASLLNKIHTLAKKRGVEVVQVNPQDTSTIGMLKYAPQLSLSKDIAAAYVIGRRALGFEERLPKNYRALLEDPRFRENGEAFYREKAKELRERRKHEKNPYLKRRWSRELRKAERALLLISSQGSSGSREGSTDGRNPYGANPWRVLRVGLLLPLLGHEVPRDLSPLKPVLVQGLWEGRKAGLGPPLPVGGRSLRADAVNDSA
ncbi:IS200/IS605 family accessory protein TnpB-related protein [Thermus filiformis]|uniref:IS200/IS605 family accessory protein TnpB-related protein n=1 Tax=Thermus filiformis TaxID=276 RepID=UPI001F005BAF|nr:IS200/IS605 family accessory protein TnpB-related protein [Thermus filiformis]